MGVCQGDHINPLPALRAATLTSPIVGEGEQDFMRPSQEWERDLGLGFLIGDILPI